MLDYNSTLAQMVVLTIITKQVHILELIMKVAGSTLAYTNWNDLDKEQVIKILLVLYTERELEVIMTNQQVWFSYF